MTKKERAWLLSQARFCYNQQADSFCYRVIVMDLVKHISEYVGTKAEKFYKTTLFRSDKLLLGLNCLEPGQTQKPHDHERSRQVLLRDRRQRPFLAG